MASLLLAVIYLAFISTGLPDSLLGSAWPLMVGGFEVPLSYAGAISTIIFSGSIVASLSSDRLLRRFGVGMVTAGSTLLTVVVAGHLHQSLRCARDCGEKALICKAFPAFMIQDTLPKVNGNVCEPVSSEHIRRKKQWHKHRI